ncbi:MAG: peptide chain release factor N(5)-glutamine methyltransferase [Thermogemmatispora sp.]|uniref:peptide chain release factor N(5)-glutamine methyltransferase n=1 Tax=Thermogemmatispora sp. TaxID=1968838 RepID=UPI0019DDF969|nr:peptide chain release factor N(5)-glutamine methyltransferase [Thermogemmatispora sp.]MBE3565811.1 peptide chain release factor N(5)-glutamine methyltransferase [Thermogemmatispora sp.]
MPAPGEPLTIGQILPRAIGYLEKKGVEKPRLEAEVLLSAVLGLERIQLYVQFERPLTSQEVDRYRELVAQRGQRVPTAYLVGHKEFFSLEFKVTPAVLIPRPETERLVEVALSWLKRQAEEKEALAELPGRGAGVREAAKLLVADVGTGSGVVAVTIARELGERCHVYALDLSPEALAVAAENAARHGVESRITFLQGDLLSPLQALGLEGKLEAVLSNPPYIPSALLDRLAPEVSRYEPRLALDGGVDGLAVFRRLVPQAGVFLKPGGLLACEMGEDQGKGIEQIIRSQGWFGEPAFYKDYAGRPRVVAVERRAEWAEEVGAGEGAGLGGGRARGPDAGRSEGEG